MIRHFAPSAGVIRRAAARLALAVAALSALFLVGLLVPGTTEGVGEFNVNGRVTKIRADYTEPCDHPGPGHYRRG